MRNKFTLVLMATVIAITGIFATQTAEAAKRKVVVEDYTGAWCQACPGGILQIENFEAQYGEKVISVSIHNNDAMTVQPYEATATREFEVASFPSGAISRIPVSGTMTNSANTWANSVAALVDQNVPVGVTLDLDYDRQTGDYTATITAVVESQVNGQLAFNLWALEDNMTGNGTGWDQVNAYNNSPGSRFYQAGNPIKNFKHNDVFRGATGGVLGDTDGFPMGSTTPAGTYTKIYTGNAYDMNVDDTFNSYFVAVVHNQNTKELINADSEGRFHAKTDNPAPTLTVAQSDMYKFVETNTDETSVLGITNNSNVDSDFLVKIKEGSIIPKGWDITYDKVVNIKAKNSLNLNVVVDPKGNKGMATLLFRVYPQVEGLNNLKAETTLLFLSENSDRFYFSASDQNFGQIAPIIDEYPSEDAFVICPFQPSQLAQLQPNIIKNIKTAVFANYEVSLSFASTGFAANLKVITDLMDNGTNVLLASSADLRVAGGNVSTIPASSQAVNFFTSRLGIGFTPAWATLLQGNTVYPFPIVGVSGDPISNGISFSLNQGQRTRWVFSQYLMTLNGNTDATSFLEAPNPQDPLTNLNNKIGVKLDKNGQRNIYLSCALDAFPLDIRSSMIKNMITWLEAGKAQGAGPKISLSTTNVTFGEVKVGEKGTKTESFTNDGEEKLIVTAVSLKNAQFFTVKPGTLPMTLEAGQSANFTVEFTPAADKSYSDELIIVSNDASSPNSSMSLSGTGLKAITSVPGVISDLFDMTVTPNPIVDNSEVKFNVTGSANVNIELIDATGRVVNSLYSGVTTGGTVGLNASQLSSGNYYINARVDGKTTQIPVVITK